MNRYKEVTGRNERLAYTVDNTLSHMLKEGNSEKGPGAISGYRLLQACSSSQKKKKKRLRLVRHLEALHTDERPQKELKKS